MRRRRPDPPPPGPPGATERALHRLGRRYAVVMRTAALTCVSSAALFQAAPDRRALVAGVVTGLAAWNLAYARFASRGWVLPTDTLMIMLLCLTQRWTVPPDASTDSTNWVLAAVTVTVIAHQWLTTAAGGALLTTAIVAAHVAGTAFALPGIWTATVPLALWTFAEAGLSRALFLLVRAGAREADRAVAAGEQARRDAAVAAARRADEREHLAVLHDTAAATLLAVGTRMVDGTEPWLAEQAARDLEILAAQPGHPDDDTNLVRLLDQVARHAPVAVRVRSPAAVPMSTVRATAISAAAREALTNVARHAGVGTAELVVRRADDRIVVEVLDQGRGFAPELVPPHRRGVSQSITQRMARIGGRATVTSRPDAGTRVRLEVPDG